MPLNNSEFTGILTAFFLALAVSLALMPFAIAAGKKFGWLVTPRLFGKGGNPIPYVGGTAIAMASLGSFVLVWGWAAGSGSFIAGALTFLILGFWDDRSKAWIFGRPGHRIILQLAVAAAAFWSGFGSDTGGWAGGVGTVAFLLAGMNSFNLLDNMDGLAGSTGAAIAGSIAVVAILGGQFMVASLAATTCGACLGFLKFNLRNARIYLGNGGSLFLGFLLAGLALKLRPPVEYPWSMLILPGLFLVPATDTAVVIISRALNGRAIGVGGVDHLSHRLVRMGFSKLTAALTHALASLVAGGVVIYSVGAGKPRILVGLLAIAAVVGIGLLRLDIYSAAPLPSPEGAEG